MADVPEPITRLEKYWNAILDKITGGGSAPVLESLQVDSNGEYTPEEGVDGFDYVNVQVPDPVVETLNVTSNDTYTPPEGVDGFNVVEVNVVPALDVLLATKNGTYRPSEEYDGFDQVVVWVDQEWRSITVTGTLNAPFSYNDFVLATDTSDSVLASMVIDGTVIGAGVATLEYVGSNNGTMYWSVCAIPDATVSNVTAAAATYAVDNVDETITLSTAYMMQQGAIVDISQYASLMTTQTIFVYHTPTDD